MATLFLEYPRMSVALAIPDGIERACRANFAPILSAGAPPVVDLRFEVNPGADGLALVEPDGALRAFPNATDLLLFLEEEIERALLARLGSWVGLHAGAAALGESAIVVVGHPDTGKTTTTFHLVELGLDLLCEEVTPIDPETIEVHPFPHPLTLSREYAEQFTARHDVERGTLVYHGPHIARYAAANVRRAPARAAAILFPAFDPSFEPKIEEASPGAVLTDLLQYCFKPAVDEERLFDAVIRITERCRLFRLRTCGIDSTRALLGRVLADLSSPTESRS